MTSVRFAQWSHWSHHDSDKLGAMGASMKWLRYGSPGWRGGDVPSGSASGRRCPHPGCVRFGCQLVVEKPETSDAFHVVML
eukprot:3596662-Amphidinium_carterae.1